MRVGEGGVLVLDHSCWKVPTPLIFLRSSFFVTPPLRSKSHTPAARRSGKSAKSKVAEGQLSMALNKQSLCELRSMQQPPQKLSVVVEALCVLTGLQVTVGCGGWRWDVASLAHAAAARRRAGP